ncbi:flagellar biosynthesis regulator FlaF [Caenispirillum salinarum]|uniref:flagellar biosynthesis regulator FlaF n=1 Tax=Caenispirillum salinarum TaxID=859058 RepID=UPI00385020AA
MNAGAYQSAAMKQGAYQTAQNASEDPRSREYRLFIRVTAQLQRALDEQDTGPVLGLALHENRVLWNALMDDLSQEGNQMPRDLKAQLISLGIWVNRHSSSVMRGDATVGPLIDVNKMIITGLAQQADNTDAPEPVEAVGGLKA